MRSNSRYFNTLAAFKDGSALYYSDSKEKLKVAMNGQNENLVGTVKFKYCLVCTGGTLDVGLFKKKLL